MSLELLGARSLLGADFTAAPSLDSVRAGSAVIREGMRGAPVEYVQKKAGLTGKDADGLFGSGTTAAVKKFQRGMELSDDGIVGKDTLEALDGAYLVPEKAPALPSPSQPGAPAVTRPAAGGMGTTGTVLLFGGIGLGLLALGLGLAGVVGKD